MRILHTADWHVGKRLGRFDRRDDHAAVLAELVEIADDEAVDLVVVAGDLFDRPNPGIDTLGLVLGALEDLARPTRPVVAIAGNHDSPELFELLAPLLRAQNIHLLGYPKPPADGGILEFEIRGERALIAGLPFLRRGQAVDFLVPASTWDRTYATQVEALCQAALQALAERRDARTVTLLTGHFMVQGATLGGHGGPRGERQLHLGEAYSASAQAILRDGAQYVALGHVHTPQTLPQAAVPCAYAGSTLELDFGEAGEAKRVVLVELTPEAPAQVHSRRLTAGRRLRQASGTWEALTADLTLQEAFLELAVRTTGPDPGLADRARQAFPFLVKVRAEYDRPQDRRAARRDAPWDALYADYFRRAHQAEPSAELLAAFRDVLDQAGHAPD